MNESNLQSSSIAVYPNPATNTLVLTGNLNRNLPIKYTIVNLLGEAVKTGYVTSNKIQIESLLPGVYILKLENDQVFKNIRFVKL